MFRALIVSIVVVGLAAPSEGVAQTTPLPKRAYGHGQFLQDLPLVAPSSAEPWNPQSPQQAPAVKREVLGYLPYWVIGDYTIQRWDLLTVLAWFGAEMNAVGDITAYHGWGGATTAALVEEAHTHGVKVVVTVTNFADSEIDALLQSPTHRANAIQTCLELMSTHNADGINIDFEFVPLSAKQPFVTFMTDLKDAVAQAQPNGSEGHVSLAGPSVDWTGAYDYDQLLIHTDGIMVMAYGYHYGGGNPGPTSPLVGGGGLSNYSVTTTIDEYLQFGGFDNRHKVMIGLPWYGRDWRVANTDIPGQSLGGSSAVVFTKGEDESATQGASWHEPSKTVWYHIQRSDGLYQVWYDDAASFEAKVAYVDEMDLGGIGIWALGYDGSSPGLWDAIEAVLGDEPEPVADAPPEPVADAPPEPQPEVGPEAPPEVAPDSGIDAHDGVAASDAEGGPQELLGGAGIANTWVLSGSDAMIEDGRDGGCSGATRGTIGWVALLAWWLLAAGRRREA